MKQKILDLIIAAKRTDPETGSFAEWLAEYLVEHGVTVQEWIPVDERLPEKSGEYIAFTEYGFRNTLNYSARHKAFNAFDESSNIAEIHCSHWMPLPEPPGKDGA